MHDDGGENATGMTAREEVEAILDGRWSEVGLAGPLLGICWIPGFFRRLRVECGGLSLASDPSVLARAATFRVREIYLPGRCGVSTPTTLFVPFHEDPRERRLSCAHELLHGFGARLGMMLNEADWWIATAVFVARAARTAAGALLYPGWVAAAVPRGLVGR